MPFFLKVGGISVCPSPSPSLPFSALVYSLLLTALPRLSCQREASAEEDGSRRGVVLFPPTTPAVAQCGSGCPPLHLQLLLVASLPGSDSHWTVVTSVRSFSPSCMRWSWLPLWLFPGTSPSLVDFPTPDHTNVNNPFIKYSSKTWVWNPHVSLAISNSESVCDLQEKLAPFTTELHMPLAQDLKELKDLEEVNESKYTDGREGKSLSRVGIHSTENKVLLLLWWK